MSFLASLNLFLSSSSPLLILLLLGFAFIFTFYGVRRFRSLRGVCLLAFPGWLLIFASLLGAIVINVELYRASQNLSATAKTAVDLFSSHAVALIRDGKYVELNALLPKLAHDGNVGSIRIRLNPAGTLIANFGDASNRGSSQIHVLREKDVFGEDVLWGAIEFSLDTAALEMRANEIREKWFALSAYLTAILFGGVAVLAGLLFMHIRKPAQLMNEISRDLVNAASIESLNRRMTELKERRWDSLETTMVVRNLASLSDRMFELHEVSLDLQGQAAVGRMAAQVGHDIRSPLSALKLALHGCDDRAEGAKELAEKALARIDSIARDLLRQGKVTPAHSDIRSYTTVAEVRSCIDEVLAELRLTAPGAQIYFSPSSLDIGSIKMESKTIARIISNLVSNSIEACSGSTPVVTVMLYQTGAELRLGVDDNGPGFSQNLIQSLGLRGVTTKESGNGLGIWSCCEIVRAMGGQIHFANRDPVGASVLLKIPVANSEPRQHFLRGASRGVLDPSISKT